MLTVLQAAGCNYTVIEGDQLARLSGLRALHMQGFADHWQRHLSGQKSKERKSYTSLKEESLYEEETVEDESRHRYLQSLSMVLADDALKSLVNLELLDLQYVRLAAKEDAQRPRRHTWGPISTTTMVDMPLNKFFLYTDKLKSVELPLDLKILDTRPLHERRIMMQDNVSEENDQSTDEYYEELESNINELKQEMDEKLSVILLNSTGIEEQVRYKIHSDETQIFFAPFTSQKSLKYLRIANAHLESLGPELLGGLINLHTFTLEFNHIQVLPENVFAPTQNIRHLSIAHNSLLTLESSSLQGLTNLLTLDLSHNKLTIIGSGSLPNLPKLKSLMLEGNPIIHVLPDSFIGVNSTDTLTVGSRGVVTKIHDDAFRQINSVKTMKIMNISYDSFSENLLTNLPNLQDLTIHGNLSAIDYDAFTSAPELKNLDISNCNLTRLSVDAFFGLSKLIRLDMSHNLISELNPGLFDHLTSLTELFLHHNKLTTLPVGLFSPLGVKVLRLNHNPWDCACNLLQLHPTQTNSVLYSGYNLCRLDDKLETYCSRIGERMVYDSRVAPKCASPSQFRNKDIHTVVNRYLKCSKYHWDPQLYTEETPQSDTSFQDKEKKAVKNVVLTPPDYEVQSDEMNGPEEEMNARPLTDYTPAPLKPLDLLNIAEHEMLEEVTDAIVQPVVTQAVTQDQRVPMSKEEHKRRLKESMTQYLENKNKIKQQMRLERAKEVQRIMKATVWKQNESQS